MLCLFVFILVSNLACVSRLPIFDCLFRIYPHVYIQSILLKKKGLVKILINLHLTLNVIASENSLYRCKFLAIQKYRAPSSVAEGFGISRTLVLVYPPLIPGELPRLDPFITVSLLFFFSQLMDAGGLLGPEVQVKRNISPAFGLCGENVMFTYLGGTEINI